MDTIVKSNDRIESKSETESSAPGRQHGHTEQPTPAPARPSSGPQLQRLAVTVENLAPPNGTVISPVWFGLHDGTFTTFALGAPASGALERMAEDGNSGPLTREFSRVNAGVVQGTLFGLDDALNSIAPGSTVSMTILVDSRSSNSRYLSFAGMVIPSNDAFFGNENPRTYEVFSESGRLQPIDIIVNGSDVLDAGTEVNDEAPFHAAGGSTVFLVNAGVPEGGVVRVHDGYQPGSRLLSGPPFNNANFKVGGYRVARIRVSPV
jgi:hypothetical protein